jgi:tetratricopeptide (TPR) repeat protein
MQDRITREREDDVSKALDRNDLVSAERELNLLLGMKSDSPKGYQMLAALRFRQGRLEAAKQAAVRSFELDNESTDSAERALQCFVLLKDFSGGLNYARGLVRANPQSIALQNLVLYALVQANRPETVLREARVLLRKDEVNTETIRNIGRAYLKMGRLETARYVLNRALNIREEPQTYRLLAEIAFKNKEVTEARKALERAVLQMPDAPEIWNNIGLVATEMADYNRAEEAFTKLTAMYPGLAFAHANLGYLYRLMGRPSDAVTSYKKALELDRQLADVHYNLGLLYFGSEIPGLDGPKRFEEAMESLNQYRDLRRTTLTRAENQELDRYIHEAKRMIEMLKQSQQSDTRAPLEPKDSSSEIKEKPPGADGETNPGGETTDSTVNPEQPE